MSRIFLSPPDLRPEDHAAVAAALASNWVAPVGPELALFEAAVCERVGMSHAVALNSGTAALHLALTLLGVRQGDLVLCPSLTFAASSNPVRYCGAEPVFIDSEPRTWNMDPARLKEAIEVLSGEGRKPKAVIVVHLYGQCAEMDAILNVCKMHGIPLVEDAAEALGASYRGKAAGSFGLYSFFSFNGNKIITSSGGGMLLGNDGVEIARALHLATQAREPAAHYEHKDIGYNYRMSNVLAALGRSQLADLERRIAVRRGHFESYRDELGDLPGLRMMPVSNAGSPNYWLSCLTLDPAETSVTPDSVLHALAAEDIEARPLWKPLHLQPVFEGCRRFGGDVSESLFARGLCLPSGSNLDESGRKRICDRIRACF
ncbi:DegT/DnrJ/EryC1/StrS family aminotransferase [Coraliomargarita parva]|uniref:DegT/DnrJ/EryC1/StrS family aminotransferase n=1 Tax=Coraliomargarita parva TaxID=3014050 RepID=UPI0022B5D25C|nr:aminotransferase class I/II-fold pyridoxal phosphate-dependent enzyme [Coraliomargarita parva]